ncbi:DNA-binding transcriptional regulator, PadR family [Microbacterium sp. cf046]|uniref:PadR family transcriptional regulator n=1 Tax=Microbacterium sp. cf046 TaxID=1761803 RepID=UPI0008E4B202|nr:PadR family transcriptional regulator [Microbacterium sp. cf046]SFR99476.1 DNA-binding transcriptional regulator, PadR family [Microbacterium sp. cf046]
MTVRQSLLAILGQGPCYGYQLRAEFDRRTGSTWPLNVGQIYNTLDRLERDGLIAKSETDAQGHVYYEITDAGSLEVAAWLAAPVDRGTAARDELAIKLSVAATLPGVDVAEVIGTQRAVSLAHREALSEAAAAVHVDGPESLARALVVDAMLVHAEAELRWLDRTEDRLRRYPAHAMALELATERPKRGRPAKEVTAVG